MALARGDLHIAFMAISSVSLFLQFIRFGEMLIGEFLKGYCFE